MNLGEVTLGDDNAHDVPLQLHRRALDAQTSFGAHHPNRNRHRAARCVRDHACQAPNIEPVAPKSLTRTGRDTNSEDLGADSKKRGFLSDQTAQGTKKRREDLGA